MQYPLQQEDPIAFHSKLTITVWHYFNLLIINAELNWNQAIPVFDSILSALIPVEKMNENFNLIELKY